MARRSILHGTVTAVICAVIVAAAPPAAGADTVTGVPGDPLSGSGAVSRSVLTAAQLTGGTAGGPVADSAFAVPAGAAMPRHTFEGRLQLNGESTGGGFAERRDDLFRTGSSDSLWKHLPEIDMDFVQNGSHLVPVAQGLTYTGSPYWNVVHGPGRAWYENGDGARSRASLPFALVERNANCVHNGVLTFLFTATTVSQVRYQITQETCQYFKFDMWGQLSATYTPRAAADGTAVKNAHAAEVANRLPTRPISALATDHPGAGIAPGNFSPAVTPAHLTKYGFLYDGVNYVSDCTTRQGSYAFCDVMVLPSYSTAKSAFAGVALMRLGQRYGTGVQGQLVNSWVGQPAGTRSNFSAVTFNHAADMTTGNYTSAVLNDDEAGGLMSSFFTAESTGAKLTAAYNFPPREAPGRTWVYHTSDTFLLTTAMNGYLVNRAGAGSDIFAMVRDEVYAPAKLSAGARTTLRTGNSPAGRPFGGYGLFLGSDDVAKVAKLLNNDNGVAGGSQVLNASMLADSMQRNPADRGVLTTHATPFRYNNGFWAKSFTAASGCSYWVPFMSGYGGITVAMMPNGATYYYFSDNDEFSWAGAVTEAAKLRPHC